MTHRRGLLLGALVGALLGAGCGVPNDSTPRLIASEDRPGLTQPSTTIADASVPTATVITVFLLDPKTGLLHGVSRDVASTDANERVEALLDLQVTASEQAQGLISQIPVDTKLLSTTPDEFDLVIDLSKDFTAVTGEAREAAVAQLVYTATEGRSVTGVRFSVEGMLFDVPGEDGVTKPSLRRSDFRQYDPSGAATPTTEVAPSTAPTTEASPGRR